ncbi:MAG: hypothetical protein IPH82_29220 [Chloroflexi bacterium]|nr:hypothetical protein [Chloroflexota bacterium]
MAAFSDWLDTDREDFIIHRRLTNAANEWHEKGEETGLLYQGLRLAEAKQWVAPNPHIPNDLEHRFLETSLQTDKNGGATCVYPD